MAITELEQRNTLTLDEALTARVFHTLNCAKQGGYDTKGRSVRLHRNGQTKVWKRPHNPTYRIPVKFGLYRYTNITDHDYCHTEVNCPYNTTTSKEAN